METITKTREVNYNVYVAVDGTEFTDSDACVDYESTAICTIRKRLNIRSTNPWDLCYGDGDGSVEIISGDKFDMQMYLEFLSRSLCKKSQEKVDNYIRTMKKSDEFIVFFNCDDDPYLITTKKDLLNRFEKSYNGEPIED